MSIETLPYPDPRVPVAGYTAIAAGDVIRYVARDRFGGPTDTQDCIVRDVETEPRDFATGAAFPASCRRLHVTVLDVPPMTVQPRTIGDVRVSAESTLIVDDDDVFVRADEKDAPMLVKYVDSLRR
ncbi:hypothetical protein PXH69_28840 [Rhodococcus qingshengii]|uniref:Head-to-tail stopper n=1 Tax=Rhodococcus qingshengii TaxID=334542 RepID=A0AAW6LUB9_RHOSG|nr:hypothetical protein [Rhodococcus qingshengii]MDE8648985.1 hypothetical protein [Rhodococcus qingshengii]